ncbi:MAG TPA: hypothetical protein VH394_04150, partial [Thermoanaerobaculia bacterium]|nr:hypothetical protein [Thermoanaerobaculia bacterium]
DAVLALAPMDRPAAWLEAFRDYAALDEIDLGPAETVEDGERTLFPALDPAPVVLADVRGITLGADHKTLAGGEVDVTVRPVLVATSTIQELLCGPPCPGGGGGAAARSGLAYGPQVDPASVALAGRKLTFAVSADLLPSTLKAPAVHVGVLGDKTGWSTIGFKAAYKQGTVTLQLAHEPQGRLLRLVVRGTGDSPLLGRNLVPFAGAPGAPAAPAGTAQDGRDFATMIPLTERS